MEANHIYSLFNNALGNAIEALEKVQDPDKKIIDLSLRKEGDDVIIEISNYFVEAPKLVEGNLVSSKSDASHHDVGAI
jgi:Signal transduction histidine kinase regulating citrate/malate metabolism